MAQIPALPTSSPMRPAAASDSIDVSSPVSTMKNSARPWMAAWTMGTPISLTVLMLAGSHVGQEAVGASSFQDGSQGRLMVAASRNAVRPGFAAPWTIRGRTCLAGSAACSVWAFLFTRAV